MEHMERGVGCEEDLAGQVPEDIEPLWPEERERSEEGAAGEMAGTEQGEFSAQVAHGVLTWTEGVAAFGGICARSQGIPVFSPLCFLSASLMSLL